MSAPSESSITRVAGVLSKPEGMSVRDICLELGVSRQTTIKWLTLMERSGLLHKSHRTNGKKGRPQSVYHPTASLSRFVLDHHQRSAVMIDFPVISALCRFNAKMTCGLANGGNLCCLDACPLLKESFF